MSWLVTGGAGYIGAHVVRAFRAQGIDTVVVDDLSSGRRTFLPAGTRFVQGTVLDGAQLENTIERYDVRGVVHLAGFKYAGVSVSRPLHTYQQNVTGTATLLAAMEAMGSGVTFSIGVAVFLAPPTDFSAVLVTADRLMYRAKYGGKNAVEMATIGAPQAAEAPVTPA